MAKGTVFDGLRRIEPLPHPIRQAILERAAAAGCSQADESRWLMFAEVAGKTGPPWRRWAFLSADAIGDRLDPTRSHHVPQRHFAAEAKAVLMVERYSAYKAMARVKPGHIVLAFCRAHVRRDFVEVGKGSEQLVPWALAWLQRIRDLYSARLGMRQWANCGAGFQPAFAAETAAPQCVIPSRAVSQCLPQRSNSVRRVTVFALELDSRSAIRILSASAEHFLKNSPSTQFPTRSMSHLPTRWPTLSLRATHGLGEYLRPVS